MTVLDGEAIRERLKSLMAETVADEQLHHDWDYRAVRPMPVPASWHPFQHVIGDCSKGVQYLCEWAGAPDPMNWDYGPYGNSTTLAAKLKHIDHVYELEVGDIVTRGYNGNHHASMVYTPGRDPVLWGFGHQGAPSFSMFSADHRVFQLLQLHLPHHKPTKFEILRAKTGYWAWLQWKLGEGDWRFAKPASPALRPNVPARIPALWWKRYVQFLKNRKQGNKATTAHLQTVTIT